MHLFLSAPGMERFLGEELLRACPSAHLEPIGEGLLVAKGVSEGFRGPIVFARQCLPDATPFPVTSIRGAAEALTTRLIGELPLDGPWRLHVIARYGLVGSDAGAHRCELIREAVVEQLRKRRRSLLRGLSGRRPEAGMPTAKPMDEPETPPFASDESFVQLLLTSPDSGFVSIVPAPGPSALTGLVSPFPRGEVPVAVDKEAPSRAFAKLVESEARLGLRIAAGETCVDLGASPGSWTYVPAMRGARVTAVDRSPLRDDLMRHPRVGFVQGDAFRFVPETAVDWLLCDVIAAPERSIDLVLDWVRARRCRRFVVTIKFKGDGEYAALDRLKREMPPLAARFHLLHLCANKNEVCVFGEVLREP
jgi:23S rRNA (cytidine2498-2'-O)-methyltransferase